MRVVWAHDHVFSTDPAGDVVYSSGGKLPYRVWRRYLKFFDDVLVIGRHGLSEPSRGGETASSGEGVSFRFVPSLGSLSRASVRQAEKEIDQALQTASALIARLPSHVGALAVARAERLGVPYLVELAGCPWDAFRTHGSTRALLYAPFARLKTASIVRRAPIVTYVTTHFLQRRYPTRGFAVACSNVDLGRIDADVLEQRLRRLDTARDVLTLGTIGSPRLRYKGVPTALQAISLLRREYPFLRYQVVGEHDSEEWSRLVQRYDMQGSADAVQWLPSGDGIYSWLDSIDIYVQPSLTEGLPRSLIEAMSRACPAVGSAVGGIPELLSSEYLHSPGNARSLAAALRPLIAHKDSARSAARRNFEVAAQFDGGRLELARDKALSRLVEACRRKQVGRGMLARESQSVVG